MPGTETSPTIVFAALCPFLPYHLSAPDRVAWAASSAFMIVLTAGNLVFFTPRFLRAQRGGVLARRLAIDVLVYLSPFVLLVCPVLNALGVGLRQSAGGFLIGLYLMLLISASVDFVFLLSVFAGPRRGGDP